MAVAYLRSDTLTGIRTPLSWTPLHLVRPVACPPIAAGRRWVQTTPTNGHPTTMSRGTLPTERGALKREQGRDRELKVE